MVGDGYDRVHIFAPNGERIGLIKLPEICSNVCFGGSKRNRLFMTGSQSLYAVYVETQGAHITWTCKRMGIINRSYWGRHGGRLFDRPADVDPIIHCKLTLGTTQTFAFFAPLR